MNETLVMSATTMLGLLIVLHIGILWKNLKAMRQLATHDARLTHLADALALLTDTSETGFNAVAAEVGRLAVNGTPLDTTSLSNRRLAMHARRGQTVQQIAAAEGISEGEVRLRLHLVEQQIANRTKGARTTASKAEPVPVKAAVVAVPAGAGAPVKTPAKTRERRVSAPVLVVPAPIAADAASKRRPRSAVRVSEKADGAVRK